MRRLKPGDIAVLDQVDLDRATADGLVAARGRPRWSTPRRRSPGGSRTWGRRCSSTPASRWSTGSAPRRCTRSRTAAGSACTRAPSTPARCCWPRASSRRRSRWPTRWSRPSPGSPTSSRRSPPTPSSSCAASARMLLDGVGVPDVEVELKDRQVLVVAGRFRPRGRAARAQVLHPRVPAGAGRRRRGRGRPARRRAHARDLIVGDPAEISNEALTCGADVVVPAFADGHAPGLHRVQDLGAGAVTFPSSANPEDLALLLVAHHGAALVVTVGLSATHGRVPRPGPLGQQRLHVPDPAAGRRQLVDARSDRRCCTAAGCPSGRSC